MQDITCKRISHCIKSIYTPLQENVKYIIDSYVLAVFIRCE